MQTNQNDISKQVAKLLLNCGAVKLSVAKPFRWASGWYSPIYCDNRLTLAFPEIRQFISNALVQKIKENYLDAECIAGVATAGIPQAALVAEQLNLPLCYVRIKPKEHGLGNQIEGLATKGAKVVVIEDLISTGKSSLEAAQALQNAGLNVLVVLATFEYGFQEAEKAFKSAKLPFIALSNYSDLLSIALENKQLETETIPHLTEWRNNPSNWRGKLA